MPRLRLSDGEYARRRATILERLGERGITGLVLFGPNNVSYFSRFGFIATERPIAYVLTGERSALLVPRLEREHAEEFALVDRVTAYPEYPGERHPLAFLKDLLVDFGLSKAKIGVDADGYGRTFGYRGPRVGELLPDAEVITVVDDIEYLQMVNSEEELDLIRESARWGNLAHTYLQEYCKVGVSETEISMRASYEAVQAMIRTLAQSTGRSPGAAGSRTPASAARSARTRPCRTP